MEDLPVIEKDYKWRSPNELGERARGTQVLYKYNGIWWGKGCLASAIKCSNAGKLEAHMKKKGIPIIKKEKSLQ